MLNNSLRLTVGLKGWQLLWSGKRGGGGERGRVGVTDQVHKPSCKWLNVGRS